MTTRSSSRSSPSSRTGPWRTCHRGSTRPTPPGSPCAVIAFNIARAAAVAADLANGPVGHPAHQDHQGPRPDRLHRPPTRPAPADPLALGRRLGEPARRRRPAHRSPRRPDHPAPTARPRTTKWKSRQPTGRPAAPPPTAPARPTEITAHKSTTVDQGSAWVEPAGPGWCRARPPASRRLVSCTTPSQSTSFRPAS